MIIEIPHFASLRGNEREIQVLRSEDGKKWEEHKLQPSDDIVFKAVNDSFDGKWDNSDLLCYLIANIPKV